MQQLTEFEIIGTLPTSEIPKVLTVIEWLRLADAHGCVWAKSAIKQCNTGYVAYIRNALSEAILTFNLWDETDEKEGYWMKIYSTISKHDL